MPYVLVEIDKGGLGGPNEFDGDVERDGDEVLEGYESKDESDEAVDVGVAIRLVVPI